MAASGAVLLAGFTTSAPRNTNASGEATVTIIAGNVARTGVLTATPASSDTAAAWITGYTKPTGAPDPVTSAATKVTVSGQATKSISIVGSRTTVKGRPGIVIMGVTQGIEDGKTVILYFRSPGETSYSEGTARPEITDGEFTWRRKTGKKFYAYVTSDDGAIKSNRVIIPAN